MSPIGFCDSCNTTQPTAKMRQLRTHPGREAYSLIMCDVCMTHIDDQIAKLMKRNGVMARRLAEIAGRMGGEPDGCDS